MRLLAAAKINLHLRVFAARSDGFHPLLSWMSTVGLFDTIEINQGDQRSTSDGIALSCDDPTIPCDATNLVHRAAQLMLSERQFSERKATPVAKPRDLLRIHLSKRIPHGAGLGGGSSDAARTLVGLNRFFGMNLPIERLSTLAAQLGSDVPFFLFGPSADCQGRGEIVRPIARPKPRWATLALPPIAMPTPRVYQVFDSLGLGKAQAGIAGAKIDQPNWEGWTSLDADELLPRLINDLEAPAYKIAPKLGHLRADLEQALGRIVRMSGSGSTLFTLFDDEEAAKIAADSITRCGTRSIAVELGTSARDDA